MNNFKNVHGFEDYIINDSGEVFSKKYNKFRKLKIYVKRSGYLYVAFSKKGKVKVLAVHRLVLYTFKGLPRKNEECRHLDGDPSNNHISNLKWGTHKENYEDTKLHKTAPVNEKHGSCKLSNEEVIQIRELYKTGNFSQRGLGKLFNVSHVQIGHIVRGNLRKL